jgi:predicted esterase
MKISISQVTRQFEDFYHRKEYQEGIDLLNNSMRALPYHTGMMMAWKAALQSLNGDRDGAIATLQTALQNGNWYHDEALRQDPDYEALRDIPEFQAIINKCQKRREKDEATIQPQLTIIEPPPTFPRPWPLLIALHGNMSCADDFALRWTSVAAQGWLIAVPQSSQLSWAGGYYIWDDYDRALVEILQHYDDICRRYVIDPKTTVIAGYSMGGQTAQRIVLQADLPVHKFIGVEGWIFDLDQIPPLLEAKKNPDLRTYLLAGQSANYLEPSRRLYEMLKTHGYACEREEMDNAYHGYGSNFDQILGRALAWV